MEISKFKQEIKAVKNIVTDKFNSLKAAAKSLKKNIFLLYLAYKHPKTPLLAKLISIITVIYALSPIDLIPDFIPILGYLDDLLIVPLGITLSIKLIPKDILNECRELNYDTEELKKKGVYGCIIILLIWALIIYNVVKLFLK